MKTMSTIRLAFISLTQRGVRSALTVLGIVIGIAALISLVGIGQGATMSIEDRLTSFGSDVLTITAGTTKAISFRKNPHASVIKTASSSSSDPVLEYIDLIIIQSVPGVKIVNPKVSERADVSYLNEDVSLTITGVNPQAYKELTTDELADGRFLISSDSNSVVIGKGVATSIFEQDLTLNSQITIEGKIFKVVGILTPSGVSGSDSIVIVNIDTVDSLFELEGEYTSLEVKIDDEDRIEEISKEIEEKLRLARSVTETTQDFTISSMASVSESIGEMTDTLNIFMGAIAGISLLVGALGIANTMYMSVMERTRLIGVYKSLGMTDSEVLKLFVFESAFLGFVGGVIGIFIGYIIAGLISAIGMRMGPGGTMTPHITMGLVGFALFFSIITGTISGIFPARKASKLEPVEALRYE